LAVRGIERGELVPEEIHRAEQLADTLKQIADLKRSVQTPQQVLREIPQFLPPLPQPLETLLAKTPPPTAARWSPERSPSPSWPAASTIPTRRATQTCSRLSPSMAW